MKYLVFLVIVAVAACLAYFRWQLWRSDQVVRALNSKEFYEGNINQEAKLLSLTLYNDLEEYFKNDKRLKTIRSTDVSNAAPIANKTHGGFFLKEVTRPEFSDIKTVNLYIVDNDNLWDDELNHLGKSVKPDDVLFVIELLGEDKTTYYFFQQSDLDNKAFGLKSVSSAVFSTKFPDHKGLLPALHS